MAAEQDQQHPAEAAADAATMLFVSLWDQAILDEINAGHAVSADTLLTKHNLPSGPYVGGIFMRLHRQGVIRRVGYKTSSKPTSRGSVIAVWMKADQ